MSAFLTRCAQASTGTTNRIDYPTVLNANTGDLGYLHMFATDVTDHMLRRQAMLQALDTEGRTNDMIAYCGGDGPGFLASIGSPIRSSHAGAPVDPLLPQAPYNGGAPPAAATAGIRGRANWAWLANSTTEHTTKFAPADPNRVASYFELHVPTIRDGKNAALLEGGRVVYDPFGHRFFISAHYAAQFELVNVPAVTAHPSYAAARTEIQNFAAARALVAPPTPWAVLFDDLVARMGKGEF
ncbi:hypothetical protein [Yinghuangia seranimata]|uniref:hypothetical protein n=1 Tax=Yinghuangia seranimata TaxID=408067 RepID=UPI00248B770D|nr:hypothetical protein [Yinghuangia seranimata]MDI2125998.1 hypothetical protein [Yinghuangia seranimata]